METNPDDYPKVVTDGDEDYFNLTSENLIKVSLEEGETDSGNNFVDSNNGSISGTLTDGQGL